MKRISIGFIALLLLIAMLAVPVSAASPRAELSSASGLPGRIAYMTLSLYDLENVQSFSIVANGLPMNGENTTWLCNPALSNVDSTYAVCGFSQNQNLNGAVATLAFTIPETVAPSSYTVSLTIVVKYMGVQSVQECTLSCSGSVSVSNPASTITLDKRNFALDLSGEKTATLTATVTAEVPELTHTSGEVVWTSQNPNVATVSDGVVTAVGVGETRVTASVGGKEANCLVTVTCSHNSMKETVAAKEPTCLAEGNNAYVICWCSKVFKDAVNKQETTVEAEVLGRKDHSYAKEFSNDSVQHWYACTTPNCTAVKDRADHSLKWVVTTPPTTSVAGEETQLCETCSHVAGTRPLSHLHTAQQHAAVTATCVVEGNTAYWICSHADCSGKYYGDANCQQELTAAQVFLGENANNHVDTVQKNASEPSCYQDGKYADTYCNDCKQTVSTGEVRPSTGSHVGGTTWVTDDSKHWKNCTTSGCTAKLSENSHAYEWKVDKEATALENGSKHEECECGKNRSLNTVIPHTHQVTKQAAQPATCSATGTKEYYTCASTLCSGKKYADWNCTEELTDITTPKDSTKHVNTVQKNASAPSCYQDGQYADIFCNDCQTIVTTGEVRPATGRHVGGNWVTDDSKHWQVCTTSGCNATVDEGPHSYNWVEDKAATEDETGLKHQECASCQKKINENTTIDKLPHKHIGIQHYPAKAATCKDTGNVEYWTCSSSKCTDKYYASGDEYCSETIAKVTTDINPQNHTGGTAIRNANAATCYTDGYSGDIWCKGCTNEIRKGSVIVATQNHVGAGVWKSDTTHHWQICKTSGCGTVVNKKEHKFVWKVDKEATEDVTGVKHEECECGVKRNENTVINKLDHKHIGIKQVAAVPATCVKEGTVEYWTCSSSKCTGKYYGDAKCQLELTTIVDPIDADNHPETEVKDAKEATCAKEGYSGDTWCKSCKKLVTKGAAVAATEKHTAKTEYLKDQDYHWQECKNCDALINDAKSEHTYTWIVDTKPTEATAGAKHEECTVCQYVRNENTVVDKLIHYPQLVYAVAATCTEDGIAEHFYCINCGRYYASEGGEMGEVISREETIAKAAGHSYGQVWVTDEENHWHACKCGEIDGKEAHETELVNVAQATETAEGYTGDLICTICDTVIEEGKVVAVLEPSEEETEQAPADTPATQPDEPQEKKPVKTAVIVAVVAASAGTAGACAYLFLFKRKKF